MTKARPIPSMVGRCHISLLLPSLTRKAFRSPPDSTPNLLGGTSDLLTKTAALQSLLYFCRCWMTFHCSSPAMLVICQGKMGYRRRGVVHTLGFWRTFVVTPHNHSIHPNKHPGHHSANIFYPNCMYTTRKPGRTDAFTLQPPPPEKNPQTNQRRPSGKDSCIPREQQTEVITSRNFMLNKCNS